MLACKILPLHPATQWVFLSKINPIRTDVFKPGQLKLMFELTCPLNPFSDTLNLWLALLQALGLPIEGVVELTYSLSEHGLMPAAIRSFVAVMSDRITNYNLQQVCLIVTKSMASMPGKTQVAFTHACQT